MMKMILRPCFKIQIFVFVLFILCSGAVGKVYAVKEETPCAKEIAKHCKEVKPGGGRILNCLNEHQKELSVSCKKKLKESKKKMTKAERACTEDVEKFCKNVQPGRGRILKCLREHTQELSSACRKITEKKEGKVQEE